MFTLENLPGYATVLVYATVNVITDDSAEHGDWAETGWVADLDSTVVHDSRNDVPALWELRTDSDGKLSTWMSEYVDIEDALGDLKRVIGELGSYETEDGSTLSGDGSVQDFRTGHEYLYSLHAHVKYRDITNGYVEEDVAIVEVNA